MMASRRRRAVTIAALSASLAPSLALPRPREVRISKGYGVLYLPLLIMEQERLFEKHAARRRMGQVSVNWVLLDGGNSINDAMMAGTLDFAGTGAPGFIELWARARGIPNVEVIGVSGLSRAPLSLNTNKASIRSIADFSAADKIAVPGIRTSLSAVVLQMVVAKQLGVRQFARLDAMTVNLPHPQAMQALVRRQGGVTAHFCAPPFSYLELRQPGIHRVLNASDVLGPLTLDVVFAPKKVVDTEPVLVEAFLDALDEANRLIESDRRRAASIYVAGSGVEVAADDVLLMLSDEQTHFSAVPKQLMDYVEFLSFTGTIKAKPRRWQEMFAPTLARYGAM